MIDLLRPRNPHQGNSLQFRLNVGFRADLAWWQCFVQSWNGTFFLPPSPLRPALEMSSDASGSWGCGAWFRTSWFQLQWSTASQELLITVKELLPILVAGVVWGREWSGHRVVCHCDKQAIVACLKSRTSRHRGIMHLLRILVFIEAQFQFHVSPYIDTHANHLADDLSRNHISSFFRRYPGQPQLQ